MQCLSQQWDISQHWQRWLLVNNLQLNRFYWQQCISLAQHGRHVLCWPHQCCPLVSEYEYMPHGTDRQTDRSPDQCIKLTTSYILPWSRDHTTIKEVTKHRLTNRFGNVKVDVRCPWTIAGQRCGSDTYWPLSSGQCLCHVAMVLTILPVWNTEHVWLVLRHKHLWSYLPYGAIQTCLLLLLNTQYTIWYEMLF